MRIIVIGAGEVGYHIAARLSHKARKIVVIERHPEVVRRVEETLRIQTIEADSSSPRALEGADARDAAMVIAVADVDEVNIVACAIAHQYGVGTKIARVRDIELGRASHPGRRQGARDRPSDQSDAGRRRRDPARHQDDRGGRGGGLRRRPRPAPRRQGGSPGPLVNRRLRDLRSVQASAPFRVIGIARGERLIVPTDDTALAAEDHVYVVSRRDVIPDILVLMGRTAAATRQVFIIGGGRIGLEVARALEADEIAVTVLERSRSRYDELTRELTRARVVQGDGTDVKLLVDEDIGSADAIVTLTDDDPTNLLAGLLGKRHGAKKAVALFKRQDLIPLVGSLGIDAAISPRLLTASVILKYVRGKRVVSVFELPESEAETLEVVVQQDTPAARAAVEALGLQADALVGAVVRGDQMLTADPDLVLAVGDHVVLLALPRAIPTVERLFGL